MLAADARKAGSASDATRLTPRPPSLTGKEASLLLFFNPRYLFPREVLKIDENN